MSYQAGFFDIDSPLRDLSAKGDDLERITALVDFEMFRPDLLATIPPSDGSNAGGPGMSRSLLKLAARTLLDVDIMLRRSLVQEPVRRCFWWHERSGRP